MLITSFVIHAQEIDSARNKKGIIKKAYQKGLTLITAGTTDTTKNIRSVDAYLPYENKIIRNIYTQQIGFEKSIYDSTKKISSKITAIANSLHQNTRESTIRNLLFIKPNKPLNPFLLADNERYLRDREFILDCRIIVTLVSSDSVDITIVTRDIFSLGIRFGSNFPTTPLQTANTPIAPTLSIYDNNITGQAQRIEVSTLFDTGRSPAFTYSASYRKNSLMGSLVDLELGYTQLNQGVTFGREMEYSYFIRASRPLVSASTRLAGGIEFSKNWSKNVLSKPLTSFDDYQYDLRDAWIGYNLNIKKSVSHRTHYFIAVRHFDGSIYDQQKDAEIPALGNSYRIVAYLSELTLFQQEFYKTRYILGFGRTEDVPNGLSVSLTTGYTTELGIDRGYIATKIKYAWANKSGNIFRFDAQAGGYTRSTGMEDGAINSKITYYTRAFNWKQHKIRILTSAGYITILNHSLSNYIGVNLTDLQGLVSYTALGTRKLLFKIEPTLFTNWIVAGFRLAPFAGLDVMAINGKDLSSNNEWGYAISAGVRSRNENLIFGTMEFRFTYFPSADLTSSQLGFQFSQNLRIKNTDVFVRAPSLVQY